MDPKTPSPAAPESYSLGVTLHNATIDKAETVTARSHPVQGTGTSTPPDHDYMPVPATISLTLPRELVERILLLLDTKSTLKCRLVNRGFDAIIQSSTLVQYHLACDAAGVVDNPQSSLSYAERLEALKRREDTWRKLEPVFETTIKVIDQPSTLYELRAGNYFRGDKDRKDLYCCQLPSSPQDNPRWRRIPGHGPGQSWSGFIVDIGMAIYEHDLIVNVISSEVGNQTDMQRYSLDLVLLKFSTGGYHPLARHPLIHVQRSASGIHYSAVRIVGDNLALVVHEPDSGSKLFIFDWKAGRMRLQHRASEDAYEQSTPVFISPELLLVPNRFLSHFEVWHLFPSHPNPNLPIQILSLQIPVISNSHSIICIDCHGELSPYLHSMPYFPPRPFFPSSENSIVTVNLILESRLGFQRSAYKLIMHCCALLDVIQRWTSLPLPEQREGLSTWLTNEVTMDKVTNPDDGSVRLVAQSGLVSTLLRLGSSPQIPTPAASQISPASPTSQIAADSGSSSISFGSTSPTSQYSSLTVQWENWGPPISRWLQINDTIPGWIYQSAGQRYAFLDPNPFDRTKCTVGVADFNLYNVRRNAQMRAQLRGGGDEDDGGNGEGENDGNALEMLDHEGVFREDVYMGLKCVVHYVPGEYEFDGVLMDEERLLGLQLDVLGITESVKVLYFG